MFFLKLINGTTYCKKVIFYPHKIFTQNNSTKLGEILQDLKILQPTTYSRLNILEKAKGFLLAHGSCEKAKGRGGLSGVQALREWFLLRPRLDDTLANRLRRCLEFAGTFASRRVQFNCSLNSSCKHFETRSFTEFGAELRLCLRFLWTIWVCDFSLSFLVRLRRLWGRISAREIEIVGAEDEIRRESYQGVWRIRVSRVRIPQLAATMRVAVDPSEVRSCV